MTMDIHCYQQSWEPRYMARTRMESASYEIAGCRDWRCESGKNTATVCLQRLEADSRGIRSRSSSDSLLLKDKKNDVEWNSWSRFRGIQLHKPRKSRPWSHGPQGAEDVKNGVKGCPKQHSLSRKWELCDRIAPGVLPLQVWPRPIGQYALSPLSPGVNLRECSRGKGRWWNLWKMRDRGLNLRSWAWGRGTNVFLAKTHWGESVFSCAMRAFFWPFILGDLRLTGGCI